MGGGTSHTRKDILSSKDVGSLEFEIIECRIRVYPREPSQVVRLTPSVVADTYGAWTEIIPAGVVSFQYHIIGILIENQQGADTFLLQFSKNNPPGSDLDILGECRFHLGALAGFFPTQAIDIKALPIDAGGGFYGRSKTAAGTNWIDIAVLLSRHFPQSYTPPLWTTWPW